MTNTVFTFNVMEEVSKIKRATTNGGSISRISKNSELPGENAKQVDTEVSNKISRISDFSKAANINLARELIRIYGRYCGETEDNIKEYIEEQLKNHPIDDLIKCFKSLNETIPNSQMPTANLANSANNISAQVMCSNCKSFTPNEHGFGGIGCCLKGDNTWLKKHKPMPPYPYALRSCDQFEKI